MQSRDLLPVHSDPRRGLSKAVRCQGIHTVTPCVEESSDLHSVHSYRRRCLSRAVRGQGHSETLDPVPSGIRGEGRVSYDLSVDFVVEVGRTLRLM